MTRRLMLNAALLAGMVLPSVAAATDFRVWTNRRGQKIEAAFVSWEGDVIRLKNKSGKAYSLKLSLLSRGDREFLVSRKTVAVEAKLIDPDYLFRLPIAKSGGALGGLLLEDRGDVVAFQRTDGEATIISTEDLAERERARLAFLRLPKAERVAIAQKDAAKKQGRATPDTSSTKPTPARRSDAARKSKWITARDLRNGKCRIFTYATPKHPNNTYKTLLLLEVRADGQLRITPLTVPSISVP